MAKKLKKKIVYTIQAKLIFDPEENIDISEYLDNLRGIGIAEVTDVETALKVAAKHGGQRRYFSI